MVFGTFDHLHEGHLFLLREAQKYGELIVIVAQDHNVHRIKNINPTASIKERKAAIQAIFPSLQIESGSLHDFLDPIKHYRPSLVLLGYDQRLPPGVTEEILGVPTKRLPSYFPERYKTSLLRKK
jgi:cytidyltransferase-like protein